MMRKRSRLEMMHIILELALTGIRKTHIMYRANLSHEQLMKFLENLVNTQLVKQEESLYVTTARGRDFIDTFHEIQTILGEKPSPHVPAF